MIKMGAINGLMEDLWELSMCKGSDKNGKDCDR